MKVKKHTGDALALRRVPDSFEDASDYVGVFEPLLLEECRAQILRGEVNDSELRVVQSWTKISLQYYSVLSSGELLTVSHLNWAVNNRWTDVSPSCSFSRGGCS